MIKHTTIVFATICFALTVALPTLTIKADETVAVPKEPPSTLRFEYKIKKNMLPAALKPMKDEQDAIRSEKARIAQEALERIRKEEEARKIEEDKQARVLASKEAQKHRYASMHQSGVTIVGLSNEECVIYVQRIRGDRKAHGWAGDLVPEGQTPVIGAIVVFSRVGHVAIVIKIVEGGVIVRDANWIPGKITEHFVPFEDIAGFIY